jgi:hypothetical protein
VVDLVAWCLLLERGATVAPDLPRPFPPRPSTNAGDLDPPLRSRSPTGLSCAAAVSHHPSPLLSAPLRARSHRFK